MRKSAFVAALLLLAGIARVIGQEGHPLSGTWAGEWGPTNTQRNHLTLVMNWDGKNVTGIINPGPDSIPIGSVYLDVTKWTVRIEADAKNQSGAPAHITAEGRLEDISSYHRTITGTWRQDSTSGDFKLTRD